MGHAFQMLLEGRLIEALAWNPAAPALALAMAVWVIRPPRWSPQARDTACGLAIAALLLAWGARLSHAVGELPL